MYGKILVPLDGSKLSEGVLPYARWLAGALDLPVELLHVNDPTQLGPFSPPMKGAAYLEKVAASFPGIGNIKCSVELGNPSDLITGLAAAHPGTLIAMATHGYSGARRWLLGSVAEKVVHATADHLLLVRPEERDGKGEAELKTMLVPLDGSELAERVVPTVSELATRLKLEVVLVRVVKQVYTAPPEAFLPVFGAHIPNPKQLWEEARLEAEKYLTDRVEQLRAGGIANVTSIVIEGSVDGAAAEIVDLAKKTPHGIVVMSTHGESGVGRWLIGGVTERVVRHSAGPVLVIRP